MPATVTLPPKRKFNWRGAFKVFAFSVLFVLVVLIGAHAIWTWRTGVTLRKQIASYQATGQPILIADFANPGIADEENAAVGLIEAARQIDFESDTWRRFEKSSSDAQLPLTQDELAHHLAVVRQFGQAIPAAEAALRRPRTFWPIDTDGKGPSPNVDAKYLSHQRSLALLIRGAARLQHEGGNDAEAYRLSQLIFELSDRSAESPKLIGHLFSLGLNALACSLTSELANDLHTAAASERPGEPTHDRDESSPRRAQTVDRRSIQALIGQLLDDRQIQAGRKRWLLGDRMLAVLDLATSGDTEFGDVAGFAADQSPGSRWSAYLWRPMGRMNASVVADFLTTNYEGPDPRNLPEYEAVGVNQRQVISKSPRLYLVASMLLAPIDRAALQDFQAINERRMTAVVLAGRLYMLDHDGQPPPTLNALVPGYLPLVPEDAMTSAKPLGYIADKDDPRVYSVGENRRDDGGNDMSKTAMRSEQLAKGDEVRHLLRRPRQPTSRAAQTPMLKPGPTLNDDSEGLADE